MTLHTIDDIQQAIGLLPPEARARLEKWFYTHPVHEIEWEPQFRIAEPAFACEVLPPHRMTPEEFLEFEAASPIRHEYVAGEAYAMTGASPQHNLISVALVSEFRNHLRGGPCKAFMAEVKAHIKSRRGEAYYYPDVMVACGEDALAKNALQDPRLIIEVLSPSTARIDRREKAMNYWQMPSLEEYVLVEQDLHEVTIYRREESWAPRLTIGADAIAEFQSIGLSLPMARIYEGVL